MVVFKLTFKGFLDLFKGLLEGEVDEYTRVPRKCGATSTSHHVFQTGQVLNVDMVGHFLGQVAL